MLIIPFNAALYTNLAHSYLHSPRTGFPLYITPFGGSSPGQIKSLIATADSWPLISFKVTPSTICDGSLEIRSGFLMGIYSSTGEPSRSAQLCSTTMWPILTKPLQCVTLNPSCFSEMRFSSLTHSRASSSANSLHTDSTLDLKP
jgi:hypothetical protein